MILTRRAFAFPASSLAYKTGTWRLKRPVHRRAAQCILVSANPLPAITGRVCHHPCERACKRGAFDDPIAICALERFLGDRALANDWPYPVSAPPPSASEIAVVGAGRAGLFCAYHLLRLGYRVKVFDVLPEAGGLCAWRCRLIAYRERCWMPKSVATRTAASSA